MYLCCPQLAAAGISITNVNPGFVRTEMVDIMVEAGTDAAGLISMDVPTRAIDSLATCVDPMRYTGQILVAEEMISELAF